MQVRQSTKLWILEDTMNGIHFPSQPCSLLLLELRPCVPLYSVGGRPTASAACFNRMIRWSGADERPSVVVGAWQNALGHVFLITAAVWHDALTFRTDRPPRYWQAPCVQYIYIYIPTLSTDRVERIFSRILMSFPTPDDSHRLDIRVLVGC